MMTFPSLPIAPDAGKETAGGLPRTARRVPWRTAGIGLTSLGTPIGIGVADPLLGHIAMAVELAVALTIVGTALFGTQVLSKRAFRLLRWIANRPEPPAPCPPRSPRLVTPLGVRALGHARGPSLIIEPYGGGTGVNPRP